MELEQMFLQALAGRERVLGLDHSSTLQAVSDLRTLYLTQGRPDEAKRMLQRALVGKEKVLGPDHDMTLYAVHHVGILCLM